MSVHHDDGSQGAGSQAVDGLKGDFPVGSRLPGFDGQLLLDLFGDPRPVPHVAGGPGAGDDQVFSPRLQAKEFVEGGHAVDIHQGPSRGLGHDAQGIFRKVTVFFLDLLQDGDDPAPSRVFLHNIQDMVRVHASLSLP